MSIFYNKEASHENIPVAGERFFPAWFGVERSQALQAQANYREEVCDKCHELHRPPFHMWFSQVAYSAGISTDSAVSEC